MFTPRQSIAALIVGFAILLASGSLHAGPVNINTADAATLARELNGIGIKRAQAIVEYRQKHGPFKSPDELTLVKGIGPAALAKNRELIRIETRAAPAKPSQNPAPPQSGRR